LSNDTLRKAHPLLSGRGNARSVALDPLT
jgi:hypothetical protein